MDISISVDLRDKCIIVMAIPYYTPEGIGPVDANNNNSSNPQGHNIVGNHTHVNQVVLRERPQQPIRIASFPNHLIQELYSFYQAHIVTPQINSNSQTMEPQRVNNADNRSARSMRQRNDEEEGRVSHPPHPLNSMPLPDLIECHTGLSVDFTYEGCLVDIGGYFNNHGIPRPRIPNNNNMTESEDRVEELPGRKDWRLQLKLLVGPWQQAGMELRAIADQFQLESSLSATPTWTQLLTLQKVPNYVRGLVNVKHVSRLDLVAFLGFRIAPFTWMTKWLIMERQTIPYPVYLLGCASMTGVVTMNIILFSRLLRSDLRALRKPRSN